MRLQASETIVERYLKKHASLLLEKDENSNDNDSNAPIVVLDKVSFKSFICYKSK